MSSVNRSAAPPEFFLWNKGILEGLLVLGTYLILDLSPTYCPLRIFKSLHTRNVRTLLLILSPQLLLEFG
jgi:hypothetical protein